MPPESPKMTEVTSGFKTQITIRIVANTAKKETTISFARVFVLMRYIPNWENFRYCNHCESLQCEVLLLDFHLKPQPQPLIPQPSLDRLSDLD